ncbi:nitrate- and nitrite sensing domain-containing protein [Streptomyces sp. NPDC088400]|uniref:sensor histidine kinase n=1 Tax=Streptomyces sp. NPDC088400 TaxID=3365861 RepID=UPI00380BB38F
MTPGKHAAARERRQPWWVGVVQWRNWRLPVKLGAVLVVPALLAVGLGVVQIQRDVARASSYAEIQQLVELRSGLMPLIGDLQMERTLSAERLRGGASVNPAMLREQVEQVDRAQAAVTRTTDQSPGLDGASANRYRDAFKLLDRLPDLRRQVASTGVNSWTAVNTYSEIINGLLDLDQALGTGVGEPQLSGPAIALYDLEAIQEQIHLQHVILLELKDPGPGKPTDAELVRALQESDFRMRDKLGDFRAVATTAEQRRYDRTVTGPSVKQRIQMMDAVLIPPERSGDGQNTDGASTPFSVRGWNQSSETTAELVEKVEKGLADRLRLTSAELQDETSDRAGAESVMLLAVLMLALAIGFGIARHLLRSLVVLRTTALDVAERQLPAAVSSIRDGEVSHSPIEDVPVHTTEEFGQLARAFDAVHGQAVHLAAEQAALRGDLRDTLANLSRRSQSLVDRMLRLMEQLEWHEEDPDQLANLFKLDHLATRMRRNNENLMVLCGSTLVRASEQRVPLDNVLRAAVSEIEHYQRAVVEPVPPVQVIGYAARDLARMVAELLDNATAFSPPDTQVVISNTILLDGSALIDIRDQGFGMSDIELAKAHRRVAEDASVEVPTSRQMGLSVVGHLARRHGIDVELSSERGSGGLRAGVLVPARLMVTNSPAIEGRNSSLPTRPTAARTGGPVRARQGGDGAAAAALPRRVHDGARSVRAGDSPADSRRPGAPEPGRRSLPGAFAELSLAQSLPRRVPATDAGANRSVPVGEDAPGATDGRSGSGDTPAKSRAVQTPGQAPALPRRSRPAAQGATSSAWFKSAEPETAPGDSRTEDTARSPMPPAARTRPPSGPGATARAGKAERASAAPHPSHEASDERKPTGSPLSGLPRRPVPSRPGAVEESRPDPVDVPRPADPEPSDAAGATGRTQAGLPKRVPRQSPAPDRAEPRATGDGATVKKDAGRTHSFLSNYQSGIRRAQPDET